MSLKSHFLSIACLIFLNSISIAQRIEFSNVESSFRPPISDLNESRTGLTKEFGNSHIRLDIGISPDIFDYFPNDKVFQEKISIGADFHAFGLLFNESEKIILQVDAIDAFFGGHIGYKTAIGGSDLSFRFRIMHLSSHLVDGHYSMENSSWKNNKNPMPFGREFVDISGCFKFNDFYFYLNLNYIFRQRPEVLKKFNYESSVEYISENFPSKGVNYFFSYNFKLNGVDGQYFGNNCLLSGLRMGKYKGLDLFFIYYSGKNYYGEYYNENLSYLGAGFNIFIF